jgi:hypothetical protein
VRRSLSFQSSSIPEESLLGPCASVATASTPSPKLCKHDNSPPSEPHFRGRASLALACIEYNLIPNTTYDSEHFDFLFAMASTGPSHPSFANRPYSSTHGKLPERTAAGFAQTHTGSGNNARIERERQDRDRGGREAQSSAQGGSGAQNPLSSISDEQREEINEAVRLTSYDIQSLPGKKCEGLTSYY